MISREGGSCPVRQPGPRHRRPRREAHRSVDGIRRRRYDNALVESFFATVKTELIDRRSWPTRQELRLEIYEYIEGCYNPRRLYSALGYLSPADYEKMHRKEPAQAA
jgi:transposase InsO family protein